MIILKVISLHVYMTHILIGLLWQKIYATSNRTSKTYVVQIFVNKR